MGSAMEVLWSSSIVKAHLIHFVVLLVLEFLGLLMLNWLTQAAIGVTEWTFFNPKFYNFVEHYVCQENAVSLLNDEQLYNCGNGDQTECYVSRPAEKKVSKIFFFFKSESWSNKSNLELDNSSTY